MRLSDSINHINVCRHSFFSFSQDLVVLHSRFHLYSHLIPHEMMHGIEKKNKLKQTLYIRTTQRAKAEKSLHNSRRKNIFLFLSSFANP